MPAPDKTPGVSRQRRLDRSLFHGIAWTAVAGWSGQIVSWAVLLYAARVLTPGDFGLAKMAMVPIGFARLIEGLGLDAALIQNRDLTERQTAQLGGLAVAFGSLLFVLYLFLADFAATFYGEPDVAALVRALGVLFVLDAIQVVPRALLQKDLAFGKLAIVNATQIILSALILGAAAFLGLSFWSLIINHIISHALVVLLLLYFRGHRLAWPRQWSRLASSIRFGGHMLVSRIAWYGYSQADALILGKIAGKDALGSYDFAATFARIPISEIGSLSGRVVPGIFSAVQNSRGQLTRYFLMLTEAAAYLTVPATIGVALIAEDFVPLAIGPQWGDVVLPLQFLAIYVTMGTVTTLFSHVFIWTGHPKVNMYLNLLTLFMLPPAFLFGARYGVTGVALAWVILFPITLIPAWWFLQRILRLRFWRYLDALGPALISTALMCAVVVPVRSASPDDWSLVVRVAAQVGAGAVVYALSMWLFFRRRVFRIIAIVRRAI